jgi:hypothetical protein
MRIFVSYSSRDGAAVHKLVAALRHAHEVWYDDELGGGQQWWNAILDRVRGCDIVVFAMSNRSLKSQPCQAELGYAQALQRPILPVQVAAVDTMRAQPLAALHVVDYREQTPETGVRLFHAVQELHARLAPLPDPLPPPPPMPFANIARLGTAVAAPQLSPHEQAQLVFEIRTALQEIGDDPIAQRDIARLLDTLGARSDVTHQTRTEVDTLRSSLGAPARRRKAVLLVAAATVAIVVGLVVGWLIFTPSTDEPAGQKALKLTYTVAGRNQNIPLSDTKCVLTKDQLTISADREKLSATVDLFANPPVAENVVLPQIKSPGIPSVSMTAKNPAEWVINGSDTESRTQYWLNFICPNVNPAAPK